MKSVIRLTPDEFAETLGAVFTANGYSPSSVRIMKGDKLVDYDVVEIDCEIEGLKVRCSPEDDLKSILEKRQKFIAATMGGFQIPHPELEETKDNVEEATQ